MPKRHPKHRVLQTDPASQRVFVFKKKSDEYGPNIFMTVASLGAACIFFYNDPKIYGFVPLVFAGFILYDMFSDITSLSLQGDKLMVEYLLKLDVYEASEIKAIDWQIGQYVYPSRHEPSPRRKPVGDLGQVGAGLGGMYRDRWYLTIETNGRKKLQVAGSPDSPYNMQKPLSEWKEKYLPPAGELTQ